MLGFLPPEPCSNGTVCAIKNPEQVAIHGLFTCTLCKGWTMVVKSLNAHRNETEKKKKRLHACTDFLQPMTPEPGILFTSALVPNFLEKHQRTERDLRIKGLSFLFVCKQCQENPCPLTTPS